ncbi:TetR family transcriptional regulator [Patiriisocius marinistellae]|uniref:TetR family transcriptional regulator n=1 Tax=Patiriisocius marinistellae TaxID=2494560 RepID=A0A5J4FYC7_9FLAO|nr:TetR/AcrR family transcriptional regulator [Patiriisocius marinistellae]GEQ85159.1 TetR family transcriptional regulator [Patiriisocius marinistellae]
MTDKIIQKASEMFMTLGFKSVTMDDIAHEMGISKKTIYTHFNNKETIIAVVTDAIFEIISKDIDCICSQNKNPIEELYDIKKRVIDHMRNEKTSPWHQLQKYYPSIHGNIKRRQFSFMQECVLKNLNRGLEQKLYRDNIDVQFVSRIYFKGLTGIKEEDLFPLSMFSGDTLYEMYLEYHLRGIVTPEGRKILNQLIKSNQN